MEPGRVRRRLAGGVAAAGAAAIGAWAWPTLTAARAQTSQTVPPPVRSRPSAAATPIPLKPAAGRPAETGTPMTKRVAVIGLLNKRNGASRELTLRPGQAVRLGEVVIRLRACEQTAPWEPQRLTGAFVQLDVEQPDRRWRRVFSGWLFKERPALNVVEHPVYDVWTKSCTMSFPATGPDTVPAGDLAPRSSAKKSPAASAASPEPATTPASAAVSNAT